MSSSRIKELLSIISESTLPTLFNGAVAAAGSILLQKVGDFKDHDATSAAGMAALGSIITSNLNLISQNKYNLFLIHNGIKNGGMGKFAAMFLGVEALNLLIGATLFIASGKTVDEVVKNSAGLAVGSLALALPIAYGAVEHATRLIKDFEAMQKRREEPEQSSTSQKSWGYSS